MSVIRVGSNGSYAEGWDKVFGKARAVKAGGTKTAKKSVKKVAARKASAKKAAKKAGKKR